MPTERLALDTVISSTNLSGATVANLDDDPDSPDTDWATASSNNVATEVHAGFPTPSGALTTGAGLQEFRAVVRKNTLSGTGTPTARLELWENGSLVSAASNTNVTSLVGQVISYTWDASGRTAATIECKVIGTQTGGSPTVRASVDIGAVEWNADYTQTFTGTAAQTLTAFTQSASGTVDVPVYTGTSAQTLAMVAQSASGTHTPPSFTGTASQTLAAFAQAASGTSGPPTYTGTSSQTLATVAQSASGTHTAPTYTGTSAQTLSAFTQSTAGTHTPPTSAGTSSQTLAMVAQSASGTFEAPAGGTVAQTLATVAQAVSGTVENPPGTYTGTSSQILATVAQSTSGTVVNPASVIGHATLTATGHPPALTVTARTASISASQRGGATLTAEGD